MTGIFIPNFVEICKVFCLPYYVRRSDIYNYKRQCKAEYASRTNQRLETRIDEHVLAKICHGICDNMHKLVNTSGSSIADNLVCAMSFARVLFTLISTVYSNYHLKILEKLYIRSKQPSHCKQKGWLQGLNVTGVRLFGLFSSADSLTVLNSLFF